MEDSQKSLKKGALILGVSAIISKILGAVYRIPLVRIIGGDGVGIYQLVFPVYALLLEFSGCAFPTAISKLIAEIKGDDVEEKSFALFKSALSLCLILGGIATIVMIALARPLAILQGDERAYIAYLFLAPSIFLVSLLSCYRGYFQGKMNMKPTAFSQVIEQSVKLAFGLFFASIFMPNVPLSAGGATLAVTISEGIALIYVYVKFKRGVKMPSSLPLKNQNKDGIKTLIKFALPITFTGLILPLSQFIDSFLIVNIIGSYRGDATALFGLLTGTAMTVINLPVAVCYGISTSAIPSVSREKGANRKKNVNGSMALTLIVSLISAVAVYLFAPLIVKILFGNLPSEQLSLTVSLIKTLAPSIVFLALTQTSNGCLIGIGKTYIPMIGLIVGVVVKTLLNLMLLKNPTLNVFGGAIALNACYFVACLINFISLVISGVSDERKSIKTWKYAN
ncbi:MAG: polysaccharide biosynthesis protein [Clostridiales bacterium]|nr:polysaccharide biosynthesis protein [Clostridiales bacterium]